jgi:hypothetical protein
MFYPSVSVMRDTSVLAALAVDDIRHGQFDSFSSTKPNGISGGPIEKILCYIWNNWRGADIFIPNV